MFSSLNDFNIDLDPISYSVGRSARSLNNLSQEINSSNPKFDMAVEHFSEFYLPFLTLHEKNVKDLKKSMKNFETLKDLRSFVVDFEQYQLLTNETFLNNLKTSLNSLLSSVSTIKSWLNAKNKHHAIKMLDDINTILAPSVFGYDKKLLIGFPNGSKDLATLFENLQENWIKEVLNGGKSVSELVRVFGPMTKFESQLSSLEQIWIKSDRETYANTTRKGLISLKIINKANPVDVSDSLAKVNTTFVNLGSIADVNSTVLDEFNQLLNSSEPFTSFKKQLAESVEQNTVGNGTDDEAAGQSENGEDQTLEEPEVKYPEAAVRAEKNSRDALKEKLSLENGLPPKHRDGRNSKENEEAIAKVRAYVKETIEQQRSDAMSGEFPIDLPSESSTDALKGPSNLENGFPPKDRDGRNSKENEEAIAKVRAYVKETIEQQRSDAMSSSEMQTYLPSESSIEPTPPLPENVILDRIWYDPTQNEMYDIETGGDSMEMETSMSFAILKTEDQTVKKHSADKKVDDSSTTTTSMEKRTVEG
uniref:Uncharacterized protein n=1 Tax=Caenorhabditis japonica TaxID=281687 RepID=A0A8R1ICH8_CAEJA